MNKLHLQYSGSFKRKNAELIRYTSSGSLIFYYLAFRLTCKNLGALSFRSERQVGRKAGSVPCVPSERLVTAITRRSYGT
ncbi:MAG: hypothetical protein ICV51_10055 [Flavisolibacter sp.]|nr:hypothetical protein [Flavisolibacter sp.]